MNAVRCYILRLSQKAVWVEHIRPPLRLCCVANKCTVTIHGVTYLENTTWRNHRIRENKLLLVRCNAVCRAIFASCTPWHGLLRSYDSSPRYSFQAKATATYTSGLAKLLTYFMSEPYTQASRTPPNTILNAIFDNFISQQPQLVI